MVIDRKMSKKVRFTVYFFSLKFVEVVLIGTAFVTSLISSHVITKSPIINPKHLPFSQVQVLGFQI